MRANDRGKPEGPTVSSVEQGRNDPKATKETRIGKNPAEREAKDLASLAARKEERGSKAERSPAREARILLSTTNGRPFGLAPQYFTG